MDMTQLFGPFIKSTRDNPRISAYHISVYMALVYYHLEKGDGPSFRAFSREILPYAKLSRPGTYHKIMKDLSDLGYITYAPSHSPNHGSHIRLLASGGA